MLQESRKGKEIGCKISFLLGACSLFEGAVQPENGCNLVEKGKKQVAKSQKNVQKVCKKHAKRRHFACFLRVFFSFLLGKIDKFYPTYFLSRNIYPTILSTFCTLYVNCIKIVVQKGINYE